MLNSTTDFKLPVPAPIPLDLPRRRNVRVMLDRDGCIGFASSAIEDLLGFEYHAVVGVHVSSLLPDLPASLQQAILANGRKCKLDSVGSFTTNARRADGGIMPVSVTVKKSGFGTTVPLLMLNPAS